MFTYLFFDDQKLYRRAGLERRYGLPTLIPDSIYRDDVCYTPLRSPFIFRTDDGDYRMLYQGRLPDGRDYCCLAESRDGVHFTPSSDGGADGMPHALFALPQTEIAEVTEDPHNDPAERYKMLLCRVDGEAMLVHGELMTSPDLIHWTKLDGVEWNVGAEPITGVFYNKKRECFTILARPDWGVRKVGYTDTKDWRTYLPYEACLQADSLDAPLDELYGMPAMEYKDYYIGFPMLYRGLPDELGAKFHSGIIDSQLAYSFDGHHWQRCLRKPFLTGMSEECRRILGAEQPLLWASCFRRDENGDLLLSFASSSREHGPAFRWPSDGVIGTFRLREDGFVCLHAERDGVLATRENVWMGGEVHVNLACRHATLAVYETKGRDVLGMPHAIEGYSHADCVPFAGDDKNWIPVFRDGRRIDALAGKTLVFELKLSEGCVYSLSGDCIPAMNVPCARYRTLGTLPTLL